jgi:hypothetical protein
LLINKKYTLLILKQHLKSLPMSDGNNDFSSWLIFCL